MNNLALRVITAVIGLAIFIFMLFYQYETFAVLFMVLSAFALREFHRLIISRQKNEDGTIVKNTAAALTYALAGTVVYLLLILGTFIQVWFFILLIPLLIYIIIQHQKTVKQQKDMDLFSKLIGWIYIIAPFIMVSFIAFYNDEGSFQPVYVLALFLMIWANDVMAYFIGKRFGKTPLASKISPKKTVEGFFGGLAGSLLIALVLVFVLPQWGWHWLAIGLIIGIVGPLGDLFESALKRKAGIKDSGTILPGHGGVLDRFDAFLLAMPFVFLYMLWLV